MIVGILIGETMIQYEDWKYLRGNLQRSIARYAALPDEQVEEIWKEDTKGDIKGLLMFNTSTSSAFKEVHFFDKDIKYPYGHGAPIRDVTAQFLQTNWDRLDKDDQEKALYTKTFEVPFVIENWNILKTAPEWSNAKERAWKRQQLDKRLTLSSLPIFLADPDEGIRNKARTLMEKLKGG